MKDISAATKDLVEAIDGIDSIECGEEARKHFNFGKAYRNLNHGMSKINESRRKNCQHYG